MIWINRLFLFAMFLVYLPIGIWAILDPVFGALEMDLPSFLEAVGLNIASEIGYSEIAGLYGGLNLCLGIGCLIGIFKKSIGIFFIKFVIFLVGSIALGRVLFSLLPTTPSFYNAFFIFEICTFVIGILILYFNKRLESVTKY